MARKLSGTAIAANTITTTQLQTTVVTQIQSGGSGPKVKSLIYPGDDTAANTVGGQTIYINGSGFLSNSSIYVNGNSVPAMSFISSSNLSFTTPALSAGLYPVYIINPTDGDTAIFIPGLSVSGEPAWSTAAGSLSSGQDATSSWSYSLTATGDAPITYALAAGSSLPTGVSLASNGVISGTLSSPPASDTTYTFSVVATDAQNQDSTRQFSVTATTADPYFNLATLLLHGDGTNNGNNHTFIDSSNNNFTITRSGDTTQGTFTPFSQTGWAVYNAGGTSYLSVADNAALQMASGNFTIEFWWYPTSLTGYQTLFDKGYTATGALLIQTGNGDGKPIVYASGSAVITSSIAVNVNQWNNVTLVRNGTSLVLYINGVSAGSATNSTNFNSTATVGIGGNLTSTYYPIIGYMSNVRVVKGTAVYTANFTPSTTSLAAIANTSLLTCQSNRFIDNSSNAFTVSVTGSVSVQAFSPFAPGVAYSTANNGGSGYFDGTGDKLSIAANAVFLAGTGDYTIEGWIYPTSTADNAAIISSYPGAGNGNWIVWFLSGKLALYQYPSVDSALISSSTIRVNAWTHFAISRVSGTTRLFINGSLESTISTSYPLGISGNALTVGIYEAGVTYFNGYISGLRYVVGSGVTSVTIPTAPPTNIANTSLLLNFTNAAIFDQTGKNNIQTVGDAKASTSQYKYGTGSMYFDGTGDSLLIQASKNFAFGTGDFTVELWMKSTQTLGNLMGLLTDAAGNWNLVLFSDGNIYWQGQYISNNLIQRSSSALLNGDWHHIAVTRASGTSRMFFDGVQQGASVSDSTNYTAPNNLRIGGGGYGDYSGYLDDIRITKGYARYTGNFTPQTFAFKDR